jgi:hypothetical protein
MEQKKEGNKNLPALIPSFSLTGEHSNIVIYSIKNSEKEIFCEDVSVINGWITMTGLRILTKYIPSLEVVQPVTRYYGHLRPIRAGETISVHLGEKIYPSKFKKEGFRTLANKILPEKTINSIDSYDSEQQKQLPLWARTSEEQAIETANAEVATHNESILKSNALKFSYFVRCELEVYLWGLFNEIPKWKRNFFGKELINGKKWVEERKKQPDIQKKVDEIIEEMKIAFNRTGFIEYEGEELQYDVAMADELYKEHGNSLCSHNLVQYAIKE